MSTRNRTGHGKATEHELGAWEGKNLCAGAGGVVLPLPTPLYEGHCGLACVPKVCQVAPEFLKGLRLFVMILIRIIIVVVSIQEQPNTLFP